MCAYVNVISICCGEERLTVKMKLLIYQWIYVPTLTLCPLAFVSEKMRSWKQTAD